MKRQLALPLAPILVHLICVSDGLAREKSVSITIKGSLHEPQELEPVIHRFGGQEIILPIAVRADSLEQIDLKSSLVQVTSSLAAELAVTPEMRLKPDREERTKTRGDVKLELPVVRRETNFQLRFQAKSGSQNQWSEVGMFHIRVYPRDLLAPLKDWSQRIQLRLDDRQGILEDLLEAQDVVFVDSKAPLEKREGVPVVTMIVRDNPQASLPRRPLGPGGAVVVFNERVKNLPKVVVTPSGAGLLVRVDLQIIQRLLEDPRAQKQLLEIVGLTSTTF